MKKIFNYTTLDTLIAKAESDYSFQPALTEKLDSHQGDFSETTLLEIVLWKTNRYPEIKDKIVEDINSLRKNFNLDKAKQVLRALLDLKGFDLPMASTVLRFACPHEFQIIDQRVYRFITKDADKLKMPYNLERKVDMYFDYLEKLKVVCQQYKIPFHKSDRIIYQLDKMLNSDIKIKY